ncbi:leucine-rich repeat-containing protein kinase family protein [Roseateles amylovorans]|uniref:Leucine-rich repeat-containing serine/threonine-protein kinase n=1 Tax=Roseateles amylovorans TaxID=2978473 RepID=A0ABY6B2Z3_9BURK|nr:leucine-rich repeat-containing protein kinase family protein [Roseateles amylovorans]UXH79452.1 leucine-rich repeat-containing serine/threonine-protein kinase [Roseateles amylovorans]
MDTLEQLRTGALQGVRRLTLTAAGLQTFPEAIYALADSLEILDLSGNALSTLPDDLPRLHRLRILFCSNNQFTHLPEVLGRCEHLEMVGFKSNQIRDVPAAALPARLRWLILTDNRIEALPEAIGRCHRLQKLALAGNQLRALPDSLAQCQRLELLRVSANQLQALPDWLPTLPRLSWLAFGGNPFSLDHEAAALRQAPIPAVPWPSLAMEQLLGEGASGHIYRARQATGDPVALKLFKGGLTSDGLPESELAACLQAGAHPQLISVQARLSDHPAQTQGLLMPLIGPEFTTLAGPPSLDSCTRDVYAPDLRFTAQAAMRLATGMASALQHLHDRGLLHGDLYAHNILHDGQGQALLGDFGAASFLSAVPPAQIEAFKRLDVRALGCLLEELLARCDALPPPQQALLTRLRDACLQPDPTQRPSAGELVQALQPSPTGRLTAA